MDETIIKKACEMQDEIKQLTQEIQTLKYVNVKLFYSLFFIPDDMKARWVQEAMDTETLLLERLKEQLKQL